MSHVHEFLCAAFIEDAPVVLHFMWSHRLPEGLFPGVKGEVGNHRGIPNDWTLNTTARYCKYKTLPERIMAFTQNANFRVLCYKIPRFYKV